MALILTPPFEVSELLLNLERVFRKIVVLVDGKTVEFYNDQGKNETDTVDKVDESSVKVNGTNIRFSQEIYVDKLIQMKNPIELKDLVVENVIEHKISSPTGGKEEVSSSEGSLDDILTEGFETTDSDDPENVGKDEENEEAILHLDEAK